MAQVTPRRVRVGDVELVAYERGAGTPVLFITGFGGSGGQWGDAVPGAVAARGFRSVNLDNRGTGDSDKPTDPVTLEMLADDAAAVLGELGIDRAHVVGSSMGGMIAQLVALRHSALVDRLVLLSTHAGGPTVVPPSPEAGAALIGDPTGPRDEMVRKAMSAITAPGFAAAKPEVIEQIVAISVAKPTPLHTFMAQMQAILQSDRLAAIAGIRAPTLVVHGDADPLVPYGNGEILAGAIPGARLVTLEGIGHLPMWECPERLSSVLLEFFGA